MLVELIVMEQRYHAVMEVVSGAPVSEVGRRYGVSRRAVHGWLCAEIGRQVIFPDRSAPIADPLVALSAARIHGCSSSASLQPGAGPGRGGIATSPAMIRSWIST
jgi:hypothetical protein